MIYNLYIYIFIHVKYNMENNVCYWVKFQILIIWKLKFYNCTNMLSLQRSQGGGVSLTYCLSYGIILLKRWRFEI
jgi:hypothetical protein